MDHHITEAYFQARATLQRDVFVKPHIIEIAPNELIQVVKPLYSLTYSGDYWSQTLTPYHNEDLNMKSGSSDHSHLFKTLYENLIGLLVTHVNDAISTGNRDFEYETEYHRHHCFEAKEKVALLTSTGPRCEKQSNSIRLHQKYYIRHLEPLKDHDTF